MKKLLLGALLVMGSMSYGATASTTVNITANVVATGSIEIQQNGTTISELDYSKGDEEVLNVVFTSSNKTTLQKITAENITMKNSSEETFDIAVTADTASKTITLANQDMTKVDDGNFSGKLIVTAEYL